MVQRLFRIMSRRGSFSSLQPAFRRGLLFGIEVVGLQGRRGGTIVICSSLLLPFCHDEGGDPVCRGSNLALQVIVGEFFGSRSAQRIQEALADGLVGGVLPSPAEVVLGVEHRRIARWRD